MNNIFLSPCHLLTLPSRRARRQGRLVSFVLSWIGALLIFLMLASSARSQEIDDQTGLPEDPAAARGSEPLDTWSYGLWGVVVPRIGAQYLAGPGVGYRHGYTSVEGFIPVYGGEANRLLFLDLRGLVSDTSKLGSNVGLGYRFYVPEMDRIFGGYSAWDSRNTGNSSFTQVSAGLETLGPILDFRANAYIPVGQERNETFGVFVNDPTFRGFNIVLTHMTSTEVLLGGMDMEVGGRVPFLGRYGVRAYSGSYFLSGETVGGFMGVKARVSADISDNLSLNVWVQNDKEFKTTVVGGAALRFGGLRPLYRSPEPGVYDRLAEPIVRNYNVAVIEQTRTAKDPATDPRTGEPIIVVHVQNDAPPGGDGTFERPLNTLAPASGVAGPFGIILVQRGDGTATGMSQGIVLQNSQRLLGDNLVYTFQSREIGTGILPNTLTGTPTITNVAGDAVVLASGNEVSAFNITAPAGSGISGAGITDFFIHNINLTGAGSNGITLANAAGTGIIDTVSIDNSGATGIAIANAGTVQLNATLNTITADNNSIGGLSLTTSNSAQMTVAVSTASFNSTTDNGAILVSNDSSVLNTSFTAASFNFNTANGVSITTNNTSQQTTTISGSTLNTNGTSGLAMTTNDTSTLNATVVNSSLNTSAVDGLTLTSNLGSQATLTLNTLTANSNTGTGMSFASNDTSVVNLTLTGSTTNLNGNGGVFFTGNGTSLMTGTITGHTSDNNIAGLGDGYSIASVAATVMDLTFNASTANFNGNSGFNSATVLTSTLTVRINGSTTSNNQDEGILFTALGPATTVTALLDGNTLTNDNLSGAGFGGLSIVSVIGNTVCARIINNSSLPNAGDGYTLSNNVFGGTFNLEPLVGNVGTVTTVNVITPVAAGACGP